MASAVRPKQLFTVGASVLALAALLSPVALADNGGFTPANPASDNADGIRDTFFFVSIFALFIFLLVEVVLVAFIFRYRRRRRERFEDGAPVHGATKLELLWTAFPVVILIAISVFVFVELPGIRDVSDAEAGGEALEIDVTGRQFYWQYEYPNGVIAIDHLRIPASVPVRLAISAPDDDVIHSWWIPALAGKLDAIPGTVNTLAFEADRPGTYAGQCTELCGIVHAKMLATAEVLSESEFDAWLSERRADQSAGTSELGEEIWDGVCAKCHGDEGEGGIGPRLAGSVLLTDADSLAQIVRTGRDEMPAVGSGWSDQQMRALTTYLRESPPSGQ